MFLVKVRTSFCAALRLYSEEFSPEENTRLYGPCAGENGHGHNYDVEVAIVGQVDPATGMVANFHDLQQALDRHIFEKVDHRNLNKDVDFLAGVIPTTENLALKFWEVLEPLVPAGQLHSITIGERTNNIVTYFGPNASVGGITAGAGAAALPAI